MNRYVLWARAHKAPVIGFTIAAAITIPVAIGSAADDKPNRPPRAMTLTQAACDMLNDGETADFTYRVARDLANDHPFTYPDADLAARMAVERAQGQGCGA